ncbi:MAG: hypothetical protein R3A78_12285 [Polyangiales bacterium]|nr:hypothetical protein [Myxococcales bacterium]
MSIKQKYLFASLLPVLALVGCASDASDGGGGMAHDPATATETTVDRFSEAAAHLMVRTAENGLPAAGAPVNFDQGPFITRGLGPSGESVRYYNFDVQPTAPAPIYVFFREGEETPVEGQLNLVNVVPGDAGYSDFWRVNRVDVPANYVANSIASFEDLTAAGYDVTPVDAIVNCPIVPDGSTATLRAGTESKDLHRGWYKGEVVYYFSFEEAPLTVAGSAVPVSPIYVTFNDLTMGPPSGFVTEDASDQTHNVVATLPGDSGYSPLWSVNVYDPTSFDDVSNLASVTALTLADTNVATVNCPIVSIEP